MNIVVMFLLFMIYSVIGWFMETCLVSYKSDKVINRGFLIGPCCPIYGVGAVLIIIFLSKYNDDIVALFIMSCVFGAVLEYFTSYIMEKLFKTRWWDYSKNKYNINGRICLSTTVCFGALGVFLIKVLNPFFMNLLNMFSPIILTIIASVLIIAFIVDIIISFNIISNIKDVDLSGYKDSTEEISALVRDSLRNRSFLNKRLVNAFPNLKVTFHKNLKNFKNKRLYKDV